MLDLDESEYQHVFAELTLVRILVASALVEQIRGLPEEERQARLDALLGLGSRVAHKSPKDDEADAAAAAEIVVILRDRLRTFLQGVAKETDTDWTPPPTDDLLSDLLRRS